MPGGPQMKGVRSAGNVRSSSTSSGGGSAIMGALYQPAADASRESEGEDSMRSRGFIEHAHGNNGIHRPRCLLPGGVAGMIRTATVLPRAAITRALTPDA